MAKKVVRRTPKTKRRTKSKFSRTTKPLKKRFKDRFQRFYYLHRNAINKHRREEYEAKKRKGVCVKCKKKALKTSIFCSYHRKMSRD